MDKIVLKATRRDVVGKHVKEVRRKGLLPAVLYGHKIEPINISLNAHDASLVLGAVSPSTIVTIDLEGKEHAALVRERQKDYLRNSLLHVDFQVVSQTETIRAMVPVVLTGVSPAVKDFDAVIVTNMSQIEVEALPRDLPEHFEVDISGLAAVGDSIKVSDLKVSNKVTVHTSADEVVVITTGSAPEEVEEEVVTEETEPEVIERGKKEDEDEE
jgi:large subunit ribosomal protein L25